ncbi:hypothetical protein [Arthrobacter sp. MYb227]|uniref:hypothetical protein n=1 Tax=Arthrobacter sp. MYb227 TaxID=1848601 RepID=UPI0015E325D7|nr:hypothetical protein [Arthrobacter sp. MYb227]
MSDIDVVVEILLRILPGIAKTIWGQEEGPVNTTIETLGAVNQFSYGNGQKSAISGNG